MKSLEYHIRSLIIELAKEQDNITFEFDKPREHEYSMKLISRRDRLAKLAENLILNIDKEIEFFSK